ncbi:hypothetical protein [Actinomyces howellii]|nr:hypothetical protein [Actinomyces howellii]
MCAPPDVEAVPYPRNLFLELPEVSEAQVRGAEMCPECVKAMSAALGGALAAVVGHIASMMPAIAAGIREVQEAIAALTGESSRGEQDD